MMKKVFLLIGSDAERTLMTADKLCRLLKKYGVTVVTEEKNNLHLLECECVLTVGGDGTVLRGAETAYFLNRPLAGINTGKIGFLAKISEDFSDAVVEKLIGSQYSVRHLMTLQARWNAALKEGILNDITLMRKHTDRMSTFHVFCDGEIIASWRADGVVVFTPAGSTAYAYSAGGPAIDLNMKMIGIIPICTQSGRGNALICDGRRHIVIRNYGNDLEICVDGKHEGILEKGASFDVMQGERGVPFYQIDDNWNIAALNKTLANLSYE